MDIEHRSRVNLKRSPLMKSMADEEKDVMERLDAIIKNLKEIDTDLDHLLMLNADAGELMKSIDKVL